MPAPITTYRSLGYVGMVRETTPGTSQAPSVFFKFIEAPTLKPDQTIQYYRNGNVRDMTVALKETFQHKGGFKCLAYADEGAALTAWSFGKDTKTGGGDPYTHTITLLDTLPWLGAEIGYAEDGVTNGMVDRIVDAKINQLVIEGMAGKQIFLTPDMVGETSAFQGTTPTAQTFNDGATEGPYTFQQSAFTMTSLGSDSSTMQGQIQSFKITLQQNLQAVYGPGTLVPIGIVEKGRDCFLEFVVVFTGPSIYELGYFGAASAVTTPSTTIGTGTFLIKATAVAASPGPERSYAITAALFDIQEVRPLIAPNADLMIVSVKGRMRRNGSTYPLAAVAINGQSTAYTA